MPQYWGPGGHFRFQPYSGIWQTKKSSVRLGKAITVPQNWGPGGHFRLLLHPGHSFLCLSPEGTFVWMGFAKGEKDNY